MLALLLAALLHVPTDARVLAIPAPDSRDTRALVARAEWIEALASCESTGSTTVRVLDVNGKYSYGLLQYQMSTWLRYSQAYGTSPENIYDAALQRTVAMHMLDAGGWRNWTNCALKVEARMGPYPGPEVPLTAVNK